MWMLILTSSPFTPLHLHSPSSSPLSFVLLPFCPLIYCLSYQPIHQWLLFFNKWWRSRPAGGKRMEAEWIQKGLLSLSLFIPSPSCFHSLAPSLYLSPTLCLCLRRLLWKPSACRTVRRCVALPIAAFANRIINLAPDCYCQFDSPSPSCFAHSLASASLFSAGLGWTNTQIRP